MIRPVEVIFHLPVSELSDEERLACLTLYALYFNRDGLQEDQIQFVVGDWLIEHGSSESAIKALRSHVEKLKARG